MPRSLFGRTLLILLFPMISLQLIVGQVFIQRHFQRVTEQMSESVGLEINYAIQLIELNETVEDVRSALDEISVNLEMLLLLNPNIEMPDHNARYFYDLSGKALINSLMNSIDLPLKVDLRVDRLRVAIWIETSKGVLEVILPRSRVTATNPHQLLVLMVFASILLAIISIGFLRIQIRPIRNLAKAAEAYGKGQDVKMHPAGSTEIRQAALAFMTMRNKLDRQMEQRTLMLSGVSHDLRTPLTRMKLALAMMDDTHDLDQDVIEMERMLDGFLTFARDDKAEQGQPIDPMALARDLYDGLQRSGAKIDLVTQYDTYNKTAVIMKQDSVKRAVQNLLDNASRYANNILFTVVLKDKFLEFRVEDNGPGIPKDKREQAVQPFTRLDDSRSSTHDGSVGLGLSIATDIARAHGGTLELSTSDALGGLCARLTIPR
ncbi:MAG: HAMP domain-containing protein [Rhodobacteraceae bacterium]|nr:HAMP domain-containing protein [Paracoccaceae bacterium]